MTLREFPSFEFAIRRIDFIRRRKLPIPWKLIRLEASRRCILGFEKGETIFPHPAPRLGEFESALLELREALLEGNIVAIKSDMMDAFAMTFEEFAENCGSRNRLNDFPHDVPDVRKTHFQRELAGAAAVCLIGGVLGGKREDPPRADTQLPKALHGVLVIAGDDGDFDSGAEERVVVRNLG